MCPNYTFLTSVNVIKFFHQLHLFLVQVCSRWRMVGDSEKLWEKKLKQDFDVQEDVSLRSGIYIFVSWFC